MARQMAKTERAARDAMKPYVRSGLISQATANATIRDGLGLVERTVRDNYSPDQALYYAGKIAEAKEKHETATSFVGRTMAAGRLMICEMYAAVYAVVREERGDIDVPVDRAVEIMSTVRDTAREVREEAKTARPAAHPVAV